MHTGVGALAIRDGGTTGIDPVDPPDEQQATDPTPQPLHTLPAHSRPHRARIPFDHQETAPHLAQHTVLGLYALTLVPGRPALMARHSCHFHPQAWVVGV